MKKIYARIISVMLTVVCLFAFIGCQNNQKPTEKEVFETYKAEQCAYLDTLGGENPIHSVSLIIMIGKNDIKGVQWQEDKTLDEHKNAVNVIVDSVKVQIEEALAPTYDLSKYLTSTGFLIKNSLEAEKADYYTDLKGEVTFMEIEKEKINALVDEDLKNSLLAVKTAGEIYTSSIVSFTQKGYFVYTAHYTELGARYLSACGKEISAGEPVITKGTYNVTFKGINGSSLCKINVTVDEETYPLF